MNLSPVYHNSRPDGELLPQEAAAFDLLDRLGIEYDRVSHDAAFNMELCAEVGRALGVSVCKNLFLCNRQKTQFYLLCMMPDKPFHTKDLSAQIHSARLSFAPEELLWELLHCTPGSATVLGLANDTERRVQLLIDREVYNAPYFSCHPCICTSTLRRKYVPDTVSANGRHCFFAFCTKNSCNRKRYRVYSPYSYRHGALHFLRRGGKRKGE